MQRQIGLLTLLCVLFMLGSSYVISAQDEQTSPIQGVFVVPSTGGTLVEADGGIYTLTLEGISPLVDWVVITPEHFAGGYSMSLLVSEWSANVDEPLATMAMLRLEETTLRFTADMPVYDPLAGTLTLHVSSIEDFPVELTDSKKKGSSLPETLEATTLTLVLDDAFSAGLATGSEILSAEGRVPRGSEAARPGAPRPKRP